MMNLLMPLISVLIIIFAKIKKIPVMSVFCEGAKDGFKTIARIVPVLIIVISATSMLRESGAIELLTRVISPVADKFGIPAEVVPLAVLRPFSGGGSIAYMSSILKSCGVNSRAGIIAAIMTTSTETTIYALAIYTGGRKFQGVYKVLIAALFADLVSLLMSVFVTDIFFC